LYSKIILKAMAWAIGFGFQEVQARPKPTPGQHFWLGLAFGLKPSHAHHYPQSKQGTLSFPESFCLKVRTSGTSGTIND
jgi:hypothetical protein